MSRLQTFSGGAYLPAALFVDLCVSPDAQLTTAISISRLMFVPLLLSNAEKEAERERGERHTLGPEAIKRLDQAVPEIRDSVYTL